MLKFLAPGALLLAATAVLGPTAAAVPAGSALTELKSVPPGEILQVRDERHRYRPGGRYRRAPEHWHRYHRRPHDWYGRGCIIVGPVWFCP